MDSVNILPGENNMVHPEDVGRMDARVVGVAGVALLDAEEEPERFKRGSGEAIAC